MFDFVMKMFSEGDAALPLGMEEIPKQLAIQLPADTFFLQSRRHSWEQHFHQLGC
jgi:hypothetical protein